VATGEVEYDDPTHGAPARPGDLEGPDRAHYALRANARWRTPAWIEFPAVTTDVGKQRGAVGHSAPSEF
jgi:hypothetical protein